MTEDSIINLIDDRTNKRIESANQTMNTLMVTRFDEMEHKMLLAVQAQVSHSIEERVNGGVRKIQADAKDMKQTLDDQNTTLAAHTEIMKQVMGLLEQEKFVKQLWAFMKFIGAVVVGIGGALLLYKELR